MPVYNVKSYISKAMDSLINQTFGFENICVIMVDDCSDDGTKEIVQEYDKKFKNVYGVCLEKNSGSAAIPRNEGLKYVKTDYVMFLDPDDWYSPDFCEILYEKITENDVDLVKCNHVSSFKDKEILKPYFNPDIDEVIIDNKDEPLRIVAIWNGIHKTSLLKNNNITFPHCVGEDILFSLNEFLHIKSMLFLNNYFGYHYRQLEDSHAKTPTYEKICSALHGLELARDAALSNEREDVANSILGQQIIGIYARLMNNDSPQSEKKKDFKKAF